MRTGAAATWASCWICRESPLLSLDSAFSPGNLLLVPFLGWMDNDPECGNGQGDRESPPPDCPETAVPRCRLFSVGDTPRSLPSFLVAHCGDPASWIYSDQRCDGTNNCGDCSDELSPGEGLGPGRAVARGQGLPRESPSFSLPPCCVLGSLPSPTGRPPRQGAHYHCNWPLWRGW